jgi:hypothetical protein
MNRGAGERHGQEQQRQGETAYVHHHLILTPQFLWSGGHSASKIWHLISPRDAGNVGAANARRKPLSISIVSLSSNYCKIYLNSGLERMKLFIPLFVVALLLAGCEQVQMSDPKMSVGMASSKKLLVSPSKDHSAELKARYVAPRALGDFTGALTAEGRDPSKHGVYVETLEGGEPVAMMNEDTLFNPASVIKLATTLAALNRLGPNHRFHTDLLANGEVNEKTGELNGDLILFSGRDPSFSISDAKRAGESLRKFGLRRVNGSLVVIGDLQFADRRFGGRLRTQQRHNVSRSDQI